MSIKLVIYSVGSTMHKYLVNVGLPNFSINIYGPEHESLVLIAHAQTSPLNSHAGESSRSRFLNCSLILHLHPYFVYASSEGSVESAHMHRLG